MTQKKSTSEERWKQKLQGMSPTAIQTFERRIRPEIAPRYTRFDNTTWPGYHNCQFIAECLATLYRTQLQTTPIKVIDDGAFIVACAMAEEGFQNITWSPPLISKEVEGAQNRQHLQALVNDLYLKAPFESQSSSADEKYIPDKQYAEFIEMLNNPSLLSDPISLKQLVGKCSLILSLLSKEEEEEKEEQRVIGISRIQFLIRSLYMQFIRPTTIWKDDDYDNNNKSSSSGIVIRESYALVAPYEGKEDKKRNITDEPLGRMEQSGFRSLLSSSSSSSEKECIHMMGIRWDLYASEWLLFLCNIRTLAEDCTNDVTWFVWRESVNGRTFRREKNSQTTEDMISYVDSKTQIQKHNYAVYKIIQKINNGIVPKDLPVMMWMIKVLLGPRTHLPEYGISPLLGIQSDNNTGYHLDESLVDPFYRPQKNNKNNSRHYYFNSVTNHGVRFMFFASCAPSGGQLKRTATQFQKYVAETHDERRQFQPLYLISDSSNKEVSWIRMFQFVPPVYNQNDKKNEKLQKQNIPYFAYHNVRHYTSNLSVDDQKILSQLIDPLGGPLVHPSVPGNQHIPLPLAGPPFSLDPKIHMFYERRIPERFSNDRFENRTVRIDENKKEEEEWSVYISAAGDVEMICQMAMAFEALTEKLPPSQPEHSAVNKCQRAKELLFELLSDIIYYFKTHYFPYKGILSNDLALSTVETETKKLVRKYVDLAETSSNAWHNGGSSVYKGYAQLLENMLPFCVWVDNGFLEYSNNLPPPQPPSVDSKGYDEKNKLVVISPSGNYDGGRVLSENKSTSVKGEEGDIIHTILPKIIKHLRGMRGWKSFPTTIFKESDLAVWVRSLFPAPGSFANVTFITYAYQMLMSRNRGFRILMSSSDANRNNENQRHISFFDRWVSVISTAIFHATSTELPNEKEDDLEQRRLLIMDRFTDELSFNHTRTMLTVARNVFIRYRNLIDHSSNIDLSRSPWKTVQTPPDPVFYILERGAKTGLTTFAAVLTPHSKVSVLNDSMYGVSVKTIYTHAVQPPPLSLMPEFIDDHPQTPAEFADWTTNQKMSCVLFHMNHLPGDPNSIEETLDYIMKVAARVHEVNKGELLITFALPGARTDLQFNTDRNKRFVREETGYDPATDIRKSEPSQLTHLIRKSLKANGNPIRPFKDKDMLNDETVYADNDKHSGIGTRLVALPIGNITAVFMFINYNVDDVRFREMYMTSLPPLYMNRLKQSYSEVGIPPPSDTIRKKGDTLTSRIDTGGADTKTHWGISFSSPNPQKKKKKKENRYQPVPVQPVYEGDVKEMIDRRQQSVTPSSSSSINQSGDVYHRNRCGRFTSHRSHRRYK